MRKAPLASGRCGGPGLDGGNGTFAGGSPVLARGRIFPGRGWRAYRGRGDRRTGFERLCLRSRLRILSDGYGSGYYGGGYAPAYYGGYYGGGYAPAYYGGGYYGNPTPWFAIAA